MPFKPGQSGNIKGRPADQTPSAKLRKVIGAHSSELVQILLDNARGGDTAAAKVLIDKLIPNLKPQSQPAKLPIHADSLSGHAEQVLELLAGGYIPMDDAAGLLAALSNLTKLKEFDDLVECIERLEQRQ